MRRPNLIGSSWCFCIHVPCESRVMSFRLPSYCLYVHRLSDPAFSEVPAAHERPVSSA